MARHTNPLTHELRPSVGLTPGVAALQVCLVLQRSSADFWTTPGLPFLLSRLDADFSDKGHAYACRMTVRFAPVRVARTLLSADLGARSLGANGIRNTLLDGWSIHVRFWLG